MGLEERVYKVLIVSATAKFTSTISGILPASVYSPVRPVGDIASARRAVADADYDIVLINSPVQDDTGLRFAIDVTSSSGAAVLVIAAEEIRAEIEPRAAKYGIFTLSRPVSLQMMETAMRWLSAARERHRMNEKKAVSLEEKMKEIRLVNRAKWLLIEKRGMDEPAAHRYLEKLAMDRCVTKGTVAEEIINSPDTAFPEKE